MYQTTVLYVYKKSGQLSVTHIKMTPGRKTCKINKDTKTTNYSHQAQQVNVKEYSGIKKRQTRISLGFPPRRMRQDDNLCEFRPAQRE